MYSPKILWTSGFLVVALLACGNDSPLSAPPGLLVMVPVSGNGQAGKAGRELVDPFVVRVTSNGEGIAGVEVTWTVTSGEGVLDGLWTRCGNLGTPQWEDLGNPIPTTSVSTDADGFARVSFMPTWFGPVTVEARADGITGSLATFSIDATDPGATLRLVSGNDQDGVAGPWTYAQPFAVELTDGDGDPVPYVLVKWKVSSGDGLIYAGGGCPDEDRITSTSLGTRSYSPYVAGTHAVNFRPRVFGPSTVTASVAGLTGPPVTFTIDATLVEIGFGYDPFLDSTFFHGPQGSPDVVVPVGAPVEFVAMSGARIASTSEPSGGDAFDSGTITDGKRFRFVPGVAGTWSYMEQSSGATGTLTAQPPDSDGSPAGWGNLLVTNVTTGGAFDFDGFQVLVTSQNGARRLVALELNDEVRITSVAAGATGVDLVNVADNCVVNGGPVRVVPVSADTETRLEFQAMCTPPPELGAVRLLFTKSDPHNPADEAWHLWTMNGDGSARRQLTSGSVSDLGPRSSANGGRIAFTRDPEGFGFWGVFELHVMNADGTGITRLDNQGFPWSWSPDGTRIALRGGYWDAAGARIDVINADGTGRRRLVNDGFGPAWSPDGKTIAFFRATASQCREIWAMDADGGNQRRLVLLPGTCSAHRTVLGKEFLSWSGDGKTLYFDYAPDGFAELWKVNADGSNPVRVFRPEFPGSCGPTTPCYRFEFRDVSRDGRRVTLTREGGIFRWRVDVFMVDVETGALTRVTADGLSMEAVFMP